MARRRKNTVDWSVIEHEFKLGKSSVQLAKEHDISKTAINNRAKKEQWHKPSQAERRGAVKALEEERPDLSHKTAQGIVDGVAATQTAQVFETPKHPSHYRQISLGKCSPENAQRLLAEIESGTLPYRAAALLGLAPKRFEDWMKRDPHLKAMIQAAAAHQSADLEKAIYAQGMRGDVKAAEQFLAAAERQSWSGGGKSGGSGITVVVNVDRGHTSDVHIAPHIEDISAE